MSDETTTKADAIAPRPAAALPVLPPSPTRAGTMAMAQRGLMPQSIGEAYQLATYLHKSNAVPNAAKRTPETVLTLIMKGIEIGIPPISACQNIINIKGNLALKADLQLAVVRQSGLLEYFDEGFEERGISDTDLADPARECVDAPKILALVKMVPEGMPYGWCTAKRTGERRYTTRVFTWVDAERAFVYEQDEEGAEQPQQRPQNQRREKKKLSEKFNYQAWPQSMYPRRARSQVFAFLYSDVLTGMPSVEALEGGQVIDADYTEETGNGPTADELMAEITSRDPELATGINAGMEVLKIANGRRLQLLVQHREDPTKLYAWLRDEHAKRQGKDGAPPKKPGKAAKEPKDASTAPPIDTTATTAPAAETPPAEQPKDPTDEEKRRAAADAFVDGLDGPQDTARDAQVPTSAAPVEIAPAAAEPVQEQPRTRQQSLTDLASKFRKNLTSF